MVQIIIAENYGKNLSYRTSHLKNIVKSPLMLRIQVIVEQIVSQKKYLSENNAIREN